MKTKITKILALILAAVMTLTLMTGCASSGDGKGTKTEDGNKVLFSYDGTDVTLKEAWLYAKMTAAQYEQSYGSTYGEDFWSMTVGQDDNGEDQTFESYVKEQVITQIKQVIVLNKKAKKYNCELTHEEKESASDSALSYYKDEDGKKAMKECGATREDVEKIYKDTTLASKVQEAVEDKAKVKVTDDEARKSTIYRIVFATTKTDKNGKTVNMSKAEKAKVKAKAEKALKQIQDGKDIKKVAKAQNYTNTDESYAKGESEEGKAFEKTMKGLKDGEIAPKVLECDNGYVIAKLVAYTDKDETKSNKESLLEEKKTEAFNKQYDKWTKKLEKKWSYEKDVKQKLWAQVSLKSSEDSTSTGTSEETTKAKDQSESTTKAKDSDKKTTAEATQKTTQTKKDTTKKK